jgi:hypothetical protein
MASRRNLYHEIIESLDRERLLDPRWDVESATDVAWSVTSWEVWEQLTVGRGRSKEDYLRMVRTLLRRTLLTRNER